MERARFIAILLKVPIVIGNKYIQLLMYSMLPLIVSIRFTIILCHN